MKTVQAQPLPSDEPVTVQAVRTSDEEALAEQLWFVSRQGKRLFMAAAKAMIAGFEHRKVNEPVLSDNDRLLLMQIQNALEDGATLAARNQAWELIKFRWFPEEVK